MALESINAAQIQLDAQEQRQRIANTEEDRKLKRLEEFHKKIADTLHSANDEGHYNQLVDALHQFGYPVDKYRVRPGGPGWQALRDAAFGEANQMLDHLKTESYMRAQKAATYQRTPGVMTEPGQQVTVPNPARPAAPAFDFSTPPVPYSPGMGVQPPQPGMPPAQPGATSPLGVNLSAPDAGGLPPSISPSDPTGAAALPPQGAAPAAPPAGQGIGFPTLDSPIRQASMAHRGMVEHDARRQELPETVTYTTPGRTRKGYYISSDIPGEKGEFVEYPEGFEPDPEKGKGAHDPAAVATIKEALTSFNKKYGTNVDYVDFAPMYEHSLKRGVPLVFKDGKVDFGDPFEGGKADVASEHIRLAQERIAQKTARAGGGLTPEQFVSMIQEEYPGTRVNKSDYMFWAQDHKRGGEWAPVEETLPDGTKQKVYRKVGNIKGSQAWKTAEEAAAVKERLMPSEFRGFEPWFEGQKLAHNNPSMDRTNALQHYGSMMKGQPIEYENGLWVTKGPAVKGTAAQRMEIMAKNSIPVGERGVEEFRNQVLKDYEGVIDPNVFTVTKARAIRDAINRGGVPHVTKDGDLVTFGTNESSKADAIQKRINIAERAMNLKELRFDFDKDKFNKNFDLAMQKYGFMRETNSIEAKERLARSRSIFQADAKLYPRISAGFTLLGHIKQTYDIAAEDKHTTEEVIGWINKLGTVQNLKNEMDAIFSTGKESYAKATGRSLKSITLMMGLASLDAEIDRAYFQGQGNLAEEARKRLDAMVLGLKNAPTQEVFLDALVAMKGYVNEIITTPLPGDFADNPDMQKMREESRRAHMDFMRKTRTSMPAPDDKESIDKASVLRFRDDDPNSMTELRKLVENGGIKDNMVVEFIDGNGAVHQKVITNELRQKLMNIGKRAK